MSRKLTDFSRFDAVRGTYPETQFHYVPELRQLPTRPTSAGDGLVIEADTFTSLVATNQFATWIQTVLMRADQTQAVQFPPDMRLSQDLCYMLRIYTKVRAGFLDEPLVEVRRHSTNSFRRAAEKLHPDLEAFVRVEREVTNEVYRAAIRRRVGRAWLAIGYHHFWTGHTIRAADAYLHALAYPDARLKALKYLALTPVVRVLRARRSSG